MIEEQQLDPPMLISDYSSATQQAFQESSLQQTEDGFSLCFLEFQVKVEAQVLDISILFSLPKWQAGLDLDGQS